MSTSDGSTAEYTGKDVSYYIVRIASPKRLEPYDAECEDIIEALGMTFAEGCAFKAIWRKCAARTLGIAKAGYKGGLYDAEKAEYYGARMVAAELRAATVKESLTVHPVHPATFDHIDPADVEIASAIDDESERMQAIGQSGEMASEVYAAVDQSAWANCELESLTSESRKDAKEDENGVFWSERGRAFNMNRWRVRRWLK